MTLSRYCSGILLLVWAIGPFQASARAEGEEARWKRLRYQLLTQEASKKALEAVATALSSRPKPPAANLVEAVPYPAVGQLEEWRGQSEESLKAALKDSEAAGKEWKRSWEASATRSLAAAQREAEL